jgi:hypothetical protein
MDDKTKEEDAANAERAGWEARWVAQSRARWLGLLWVFRSSEP